MLLQRFYIVVLFTTATIVLLAVSLLSTPTQAAIPHSDIEVYTNVIRPGDFEGSPQDVSSEWTLSNSAGFTDPSARSVLFSVDPVEQPILFQNSNAPTIISNTIVTPQVEKKVYLPIILKQYDSNQPYHNLSINKTASASVVHPTNLLTYTLHYSVNGNQPAPDLTLVDNLPEYVTYQSCTGGLLCSESNGTVTWRLGDVPAGTNGVVKTVVRVNDQVFTTPVLSNTATLRDSSGLTVNDTVTTFITDEHELSVSQTAIYTNATVYQPYYPLTYTIHYTVSGNGIAPALTLFDTLPQSTTYFSCSGGLTCNEANGEVTWNLGNVLPNTTGIVTVALALDELWFKYGTALQNTIVLTDTTGKIVTDTHTLPIPRDIAILFDMSGSMQYDTTSYGFYEPFGEGTVAWYNINNGIDYPNPDYIHRIPIDHLPVTDLLGNSIGDGGNNAGNLCWGRDGNPPGYFTVGGSSDLRRYVVVEAELYSLNTSLLAGPFRQPGQGYWAAQHANWRTVARMLNNTWDPDSSFAVGATPILPAYSRGSFVSHHPFVTWAVDNLIPFGHDYTLAEVRDDPNNVPSLEYDFITANDWEGTSNNDNTRIWVRMQGGGLYGGNYHQVYWAVYEHSNLYGTANGNPLNASPLGSGQIEMIREIANGSNVPMGASYGGADGNRWTWRQLTDSLRSLDLANGTRYVLKIWAGGVGVDLDQIVIGNRNDAAFTTNYSSGATTLQATPGSAFRQACNRCNPIYGLTVDQADCLPPNDNGTSTVPQDSYDLSHPNNNPLYSGYQPIRGAKEGVKHLIRNLNPQFDQVGVVGYSTSTPGQARVELRCLKYYGSNCYTGPHPISYTEVLEVIEKVPPDGSTNMAQAMLKGLEMLGVNADGKVDYYPNLCQNNSNHCARWPSRRIMVLITDGVPNLNSYDSGGSRVNCYATDIYQPNTGSTPEDRANDCVIHYGTIAAQNDVTVYTIALGSGANTQLLQTVVDLPQANGAHYWALYPAQLNDIFDAILEANQ